MPLELKPGEMVLFPKPYIPTEHAPIVVSTRRVVEFAPKGAFPIAEIEMDKIDSMGRQTVRPYTIIAVILALLGSTLVIAAVAKVLPAVLQAGVDKDAADKKTGGGGDGEQEPEQIQGRNADDDFPAEFGTSDDKKAKLLAQAEKLKKLKQTKVGVPPLAVLVVPVLMVLAAAGCLYGGHVLYRRRRYLIYCRSGQTVYRMETKDEIQQNMILTMIEAAHSVK